ncbi:class I SAM-dependent methyltransferase [Roseomonas nepalensis]|uniref:Class I SAM-dependent methyltransferase n=1 Tax=Muricoccus nepalensis TaxID=1854500 RepID=A0A502FWT4_9PROT|nr:class I SAM-dependent methyltransferase [Roseomonas nepalensis]TPG53403.1 class I SAM-dependent methyltransferase [Roseomonas nepalensis]
MLRRAAVQVIDRLGLGGPARRAHARLQAAGFVGGWTPLVPETDFANCVASAIQRLQLEEPGEAFGNYLEFGVSRGTSMACVFHVLQQAGLSRARLIGFDSFRGLPPEAAGQGWPPGAYHSTLSATRRYLASEGVDLKRVELVPGWFRDTLTPARRTALSIGKASLIMIDCDIYSASKEALAFCAPLIGERAILVFDDWGWRSDHGDIGQKEAFEEFMARNPDLRAEPLDAYIPQARVFLMRRVPQDALTPWQPAMSLSPAAGA